MDRIKTQCGSTNISNTYQYIPDLNLDQFFNRKSKNAINAINAEHRDIILLPLDLIRPQDLIIIINAYFYVLCTKLSSNNCNIALLNHLIECEPDILNNCRQPFYVGECEGFLSHQLRLILPEKIILDSYCSIKNFDLTLVLTKLNFDFDSTLTKKITLTELTQLHYVIYDRMRSDPNMILLHKYFEIMHFFWNCTLYVHIP
jgi:hypothetical protein